MRPPGAGRLTSTRSTSRSVRSFARASSRSDALDRRVGAGHRHDPARAPAARSAARRRRRRRAARPRCARGRRRSRRTMSRGRTRETVRTAAAAPGDPRLHPHEAVPAAQRSAAGASVAAAARSRRRSTVIGWWMVVTRGRPSSRDAGAGRSRGSGCRGRRRTRRVALAQQAGGAQREGERLGEAGGPHRGELEQVDPVAELAAARGAEGVGLAVEVEAGHLGQPHPWVQCRGRAGPRTSTWCPRRDQLTSEVPDVDALAAAVRLAAVGQQRDPHPRPPARPGPVRRVDLDQSGGPQPTTDPGPRRRLVSPSRWGPRRSPSPRRARCCPRRPGRRRPGWPPWSRPGWRG